MNKNFKIKTSDNTISIFIVLCSFQFTGIFFNNIQAQQQPRYSQYMMNEFIINPAVAGNDGRTVLNLTGRKEWMGFGEGIPTPQTYSFSLQGRTLDREVTKKLKASGSKYSKLHKGKVGLGISITGDNSGPLNSQVLSAAYAYHIYSGKAQLSFGLNGSFTQLGINRKYLYFEDNNDVMLGLTSSSIWIPDFGLGINIKFPTIHFGISTDHLLNSVTILGNTEMNTNSTSVGFGRIFYLTGAYQNQLYSNPRWQYEPSLVVKFSDWFGRTGMIAQADFSVRMIFLNKLWFGAGYRTSNDFIALTGLKFNDIYLTYSFDYGNNGITKYSYGSHEISISAKFGSEIRKLKCKADRKPQ